MKDLFKKIINNVKANMKDATTRNATVIGVGFTVCCCVMCIAAAFLK